MRQLLADICQIPRIVRNWVTYRSGGELPPPRPVPPPAERIHQQVIEGELLMFEVDRRTGKFRMAAVRKERRQ
jgi:hypothetical protein